jgi:hypothetical protein
MGEDNENKMTSERERGGAEKRSTRRAEERKWDIGVEKRFW